MALIVKDPTISRYKQVKGFCWEFNHHKDEFRRFSQTNKYHRSNKLKTLQMHRLKGK